MAPAKRPSTAEGPNKRPARRGEIITRAPGAIMYLREAFVEIAIAP